MKTDDPQRQPSQASPGDVGDGAWAWLTNGVLIRFLLFFASGWAFVQLLSYFELLVVVFISSTILAFLLSHPVAWLSSWMPRGVAAVGIFIGGLMVLGSLSVTLGMTVLSQGQELVASVQEFSASLNPLLNDLEGGLKCIEPTGQSAGFRTPAAGPGSRTDNPNSRTPAGYSSQLCAGNF